MIALAVINFPPETLIPLVMAIPVHHLTNAFRIWILSR